MIPQCKQKTIAIKEPGTNLNNYISNGFFWFNNANQPVNKPIDNGPGAGYLQVIKYDNKDVLQIWYPYNRNRIYIRKLADSTWREWETYVNAEDKNMITAKLTEHYEIAEDNITYDIKQLELFSRVGNKLSIENGCIKIGTGISKVKISYNASSQNSSTNAQGRIFTYVTKNTSNLSQESHYYNRTGEQVSVSHGPFLISVSEGDIIFLRAYGNKNVRIMGGTSFLWTYVTVEAVE